jgi:dsRNA-specific ribonuclease
MLLDPQEKTEAWERVHGEIISWLKENPAHAVGIANIATQKLGWSNVEYDTTVEGQPHARTFTSRATLKINDNEIVSDEVKASTQKASQQLATVDILAQIVEQKGNIEQVDAGADRPRPETVLWQQSEKQRPQEPQISTKNALQELCQGQGWQLPSYTVEQSGPDHKPSFTAKAQLVIGDRRVVSDEVSGVNRRDAEQRAAANLLEKLGVNPAQQVQREAKPVEVVNNNYVSALQTIIQRKGWRLPKYEVSQTEDGFSCTVRVYAEEGEITLTGESGRNSRQARQKAAEAIFQQISGL